MIIQKKAGELGLAWYAGGQVCITRKRIERSLQKQNLSIIQINTISRMVWAELAIPFKKDLAKYALLYKKEYPGLRKRGISSYTVFLMITHALIRRFSLKTEDSVQCADLIKILLQNMTVKKAVELRLLKRVNQYYLLNQDNQFFKKTGGKKYVLDEDRIGIDQVVVNRTLIVDG